MNFVDILIVALLLLCVWSGYRKGFVLTLCGFLALFVALIGASICSSLFAPPVADLVAPMLEETVQEALTEYMDDTMSDLSISSQLPIPEGADLLDILDPTQLPIGAIPMEAVVDSLKENPLLQRLAESFQAAVDSGAIDTTTHIARAVAEFTALQIVRIVIFILAFFTMNIAWFLLSHALDLAFKLPVLSALNAVSGAALGLVKGLALVYIAVWLLKDGFIPPETMNGSKLLPFFSAGPALLFSMISQ